MQQIIAEKMQICRENLEVSGRELVVKSGSGAVSDGRFRPRLTGGREMLTLSYGFRAAF